MLMGIFGMGVGVGFGAVGFCVPDAPPEEAAIFTVTLELPPLRLLRFES